jgi:predicted metal-binding membrane protein
MAVVDPSRDTPRAAYRALEARATLAIAGLLVFLAGLAWWVTAEGSRDMAGMTQGLAQVGVTMPFDMAAPLFLGMWAAMVVAMMLPTVAPIVLLHRLVMRRAGHGPASTVTFAAGYLVTWVLLGVVPLGVLLAFGRATEQAGWVPRAGGAVLLLAGLYQFTAWKDACLRACRTPLTFLLNHRFGAGFTGTFRTGVSHGLYCIGCCWALMAVLFVVGLMNLTWMALVAVVFLAEKNWRHGMGLTRIVGTTVAVLGAAVLVEPSLLADLAGMPATAEPMTGM